MSVDNLEYRGKREFKSKEGELFCKYFFDDPEGERFEFFGREVQGENLLEKGKVFTVVLNVGNRTGKAGLYGVQVG